MREPEKFRFDEFWEVLLKAYPPPSDMSVEDLQFPRALFAAGFAAAIALADQCLSHPAERMKPIYAQLMKDAAGHSEKLQVN